MTDMGISQFKSHAVEILTRLAKTQENLIITKRGKPLARIIPYHEADMTPRPGKLANTLVFEEDIVSPLGKEMWSKPGTVRANVAMLGKKGPVR